MANERNDDAGSSQDDQCFAIGIDIYLAGQGIASS